MTLQQYRELRKLSRREAGLALQVDQATIWRWEKNKSFPEPEQIRDIWVWSQGAVTANDFINPDTVGGQRDRTA